MCLSLHLDRSDEGYCSVELVRNDEDLIEDQVGSGQTDECGAQLMGAKKTMKRRVEGEASSSCLLPRCGSLHGNGVD
jgi:hypothetical protein